MRSVWDEIFSLYSYHFSKGPQKQSIGSILLSLWTHSIFLSLTDTVVIVHRHIDRVRGSAVLSGLLDPLSYTAHQRLPGVRLPHPCVSQQNVKWLGWISEPTQAMRSPDTHYHVTPAALQLLCQSKEPLCWMYPAVKSLISFINTFGVTHVAQTGRSNRLHVQIYTFR